MRVSFPGFIRNLLVLLRLTTAIAAVLLLIAMPYRLFSEGERLHSVSSVRYRAKEVSFPGFENGYLIRVNARGEAIGVAWNGNSCGAQKHPFLWKDGKLTPLSVPKKLTSATAIDINDDGVIVGYGLDAQGKSCGILWEKGNVKLILVGKPDNDTMLIAVNGKGDLAGSFREAKDPTLSHAFLIADNRGKLLGDFHATCMNSGGSVAGVVLTDPSKPLPVAYHAGRLVPLPLPQNSKGALVYDMNNQGLVVGVYAASDNQPYPALWNQGQLTPISRNPGVAFGLNDRGQITGYSPRGGMLWEKGSETALKDAIQDGDSVRPVVAFDINDTGTIVGWSQSNENTVRGFILSPIQ